MNYFYDLPNELQEKIINHSKEFYYLESGQVFNLNKCYSYGCYDLLRIDKVIKQQQQKQTIYRVLGFVKMKKLPYETETRPKSHLWRPINFIAINIKSIDNKIKIVDRTAHLNNKIYYNYILIDKTALINNLDYETKLEIENHKNILKHLANYYYAVYNKKMNYYNNDFLKLPKF
jgi:hypothetical protein